MNRADEERLRFFPEEPPSGPWWTRVRRALHQFASDRCVTYLFLLCYLILGLTEWFSRLRLPSCLPICNWLYDLIAWFSRLQPPSCPPICNWLYDLIAWFSRLRPPSCPPIYNWLYDLIAWFSRLQPPSCPPICNLLYDLIAWFSRLRPPSCPPIELFRNCFAFCDEWLHRGIRSKPCVYGTLVICLVVSAGFAIFCSVMILLAERVVRYKYSVQDNWALATNDLMSYGYGDIEHCLESCSLDKDCVLVAYDEDSSNECHFYTRTPFFYNLKSFRHNSSQLFLKWAYVSPGVREDDGMFYFLSHRPVPAHEASKYCEVGSDYYHIAVQGYTTTVQDVAIKLRRQNYARNGDATSGVIFECYNASLTKLDNSATRLRKGIQKFALAREKVTLDVAPGTTGFALCQGDPFNLFDQSHFVSTSDYLCLEDEDDCKPQTVVYTPNEG